MRHPRGVKGFMFIAIQRRRVDRHVPWGALAQVMDAIKQSGLTQVSLVTQPYTR